MSLTSKALLCGAETSPFFGVVACITDLGTTADGEGFCDVEFGSRTGVFCVGVDVFGGSATSSPPFLEPTWKGPGVASNFSPLKPLARDVSTVMSRFTNFTATVHIFFPRSDFNTRLVLVSKLSSR